MKTLLRGLLAAFLLTAFALPATSAFARDKVVYHINDAEHQALAGLRNVRNQLDTAPDTVPDTTTRTTSARPGAVGILLPA